MKYTCLIVEDELPAQKILHNFIGKLNTLEVIGTCKNALEASDFLINLEVDILFLDINLPGFSGIDFLKSLSKPPKVIFTTAYAEYAAEGFNLEAVDYLVKPFAFDRFLKAVQKAIQQIKSNHQSIDNITLENEDDIQYVFIKADKKFHRIDLLELKFIESLRDYVKLYYGNKELVVLQSLKQWEDILPSKDFIRVHKSFIVNLAKIDTVDGNMIFIENTEIPIGRSYREAFIKKIESRHL